ncbi:MAG: MFS transporter [Anaerolineae bacterium]|nr:MAG: MFS transporter [Anaerolineae bacterium]
MLHIPPSLRHRQFRLLWIGLLLSVAGSRMQFWGLLWHIRTLSDQPIALGAIGLARIIPIVVFSLIGGVVADMRNRRQILFLTQGAAMLVALALGLLTSSGHINLWLIYLLSVIEASAFAFDIPARQALVPNLLPERDLPNAFSLQSIAFTTGSIVGPALSGLVIGYLGQAQVYYLNALSYLAMFMALILMGTVKQSAAETAPKGVSSAAIRQGVRFILGQPIILSSMLLDFFATFFASANALLPIFARDILHVGEIGYGWLSAAQSVGAALAAGVLSQVRELRRQGPILLLSVIAFGAATILFGLSRNYWLSFLALMGTGAADSVSTVIRNTIRQLQTPDELRGRMVSVNQIFFIGGPQLGELEAGLAAQFLGPVFAVLSGGVGCILAVGWIARRWPQLRMYDS